MKFIIKGERISGKEINEEYENYKLCNFSYDCLKFVSKWQTLYQLDNRGMKQLKIHVLEVYIKGMIYWVMHLFGCPGDDLVEEYNGSRLRCKKCNRTIFLFRR